MTFFSPSGSVGSSLVSVLNGIFSVRFVTFGSTGFTGAGGGATGEMVSSFLSTSLPSTDTELVIFLTDFTSPLNE